jgi:hypothetical protein
MIIGNWDVALNPLDDTILDRIAFGGVKELEEIYFD